jgi:murein DD-endopeptidase MepM/ murein hydrolase activator NlpD
MDIWPSFLSELQSDGVAILDRDIPLSSYVPLDLSIHNKDIQSLNIGDAAICQTYITDVLKEKKGKVAYGGYLEQRNLYGGHANFNLSETEQRNIHLGMDFWCAASTKVLVPFPGKVHSFKNNATLGDYGPTIILEHQWDHDTFHTLYGHLSLSSLDNLYIGKYYDAGDCLALLGTEDINVGYAPHLHFQIILDIQGNVGDYPGVASKKDLPFYEKNCPNPNLLLNI